MSLEEKNVEARKRIMEAVEKTEEKETVDLAAQLSVRDRLMRAQRQIVVETVLEDDLGEFTVRNRALTSSERKRLYELSALMQNNPKDMDAYGEAVEGYRAVLADTNLTETVDWLDETVCGDALVIGFATYLLYGSMAKIAEVDKQIVSFRGVRPGADSPGDMP